MRGRQSRALVPGKRARGRIHRATVRIQRPLAWLDRLEALVARELAPSARKIRTALRIATIVTIAIGLDASCHVNTQLGAVIVWLLAGAGPMMSIRKALTWQIAVMLALITSVMMARAFAETPWLMLPFVFVWISFSTYVGATRKLGVGMLVIQIVCLITFYGVVFAPEEIGWNAAASFDGSAIAFGVIVLFDNWLWPDPGEPILMESLGRASRVPVRSCSGLRIFFSPAKAYLDRHCRHRLPTYPHIWRCLIRRWPRARPSIAGRSCLLRSRVRRASVLKWIA